MQRTVEDTRCSVNSFHNICSHTSAHVHTQVCTQTTNMNIHILTKNFMSSNHDPHSVLHLYNTINGAHEQKPKP